MNHIMSYGSDNESDDELIGPPPPPTISHQRKIDTEKISENETKKIKSLKITEEKQLSTFKAPFEIEKGSKTIQEPDLQESGESSEDSEDEGLIGPPLPPGFETTESGLAPPGVDEENNSDNHDFIGPPVPDSFKTKTESASGDSSEESDNEIDYDVHSVIPVNSNVSINHGSKAVVALAVDPAGARLATGSVDYDVRFWDFAGMDNSLQSFRTLVPCGNNPIKALNYSSTGDTILVVSGMSQAKVLDRDGHEVMECVRGDQYVTDMARTKGHIAPLTSGCWHPRTKEEFLTSSEDGTCRLWDIKNNLNHKNVIKCRANNGLKTTPTSCAYNRDGSLIACACTDGSIQMWDHRKMFVNTALLLRNAHQTGTETSSLVFCYGGSLIATRGGDDTLKLWDMKMFKKPVHSVENLFSRYPSTDCMFSPNDSMIITGLSLEKGETGGKMLFFSTSTMEKMREVIVSDSHVIKTLWHPRLQQIFVGCGNGEVKAYYNEEKSIRGAKLCASKTRKKKKQVEVVDAQQIITPHALPMFRQDKPKSLRKKMEKDRLDPVKSHRPDLPIKSGQGGRVAASGSTLSSYVIRNLGLSKRVEDDQDPREAILRFAKEAAENPYWISPAYAKTQPQTIFQSDEQTSSEEPPNKKSKI